MKRLFCLVTLVLFVMLAQLAPVLAQTTVNGVIGKISTTTIELEAGNNYSRAANVAVTLADNRNGSWEDLRGGDKVRLTLNGERQIVAVTVNKPIVQRGEKVLTEIKPVEGRWNVVKDATINGRVFDVAGSMGWCGAETAVVFSNRDGFDLLEAWVGFGGGRGKGKVRFSVQGDGDPLFNSPWMEEKDNPIKVSVSIKGFTGIRLSITNMGTLCGPYGLFANPMLVKLSPAIPLVISPSLNEQITQDTPLAWRKVEGAAGYLLELQCISLNNTNDEADENRFLVMRFPAETTLYNFDVNKMPKGKWRWRVHALERTGFMGQMDEWRNFSSH